MKNSLVEFFNKMAFGLYSCGKCADFAIGNSVNVQEFASEHMCEITDQTTIKQRLKDCSAIFEERISKDCSQSRQTFSSQISSKKLSLPLLSSAAPLLHCSLSDLLRNYIKSSIK